MKNLSKVKTWLPVFSGFYGTIWESDNDEENEIQNINDLRKEKGLPDISWDDVEFDYKEYHETVSKMVTSAVEHELTRLNLVDRIDFEKLVSPREYNFANDSIDVEITLTKDNLKNLWTYLLENKEAFDKHLEEKYTTRSGFISSYSNDVNLWLAEGIDALMSHEHKSGLILDFVLANEGITEMDFYENVTGNGGTLYAKNYTELTGGN